MAVISVDDYKTLVTDYEAALAQIAGVSGKYYDAAYHILLLDEFDPEIDLLVAFHNAYLTADIQFASQPQSVVNAVKALQNHILAEGADKNTGVKFSSINEFYADHSGDFTGYFSSDFADLSKQAGFTIESTYIT